MLISCFYLKERRGGPGSAASTARAVLLRRGTARAKPCPPDGRTDCCFWGQKAVFWQTQSAGDNEAGGSRGCRAGGPQEHRSQPRPQRHGGESQRVSRGDFGNAAPPTRVPPSLAEKMGEEPGNHYPAPAMKQCLQNAPGAVAERRLPRQRGTIINNDR